MNKLSYNRLHVLHDRQRRIVFFKEFHTLKCIGHTRVTHSYLLLSYDVASGSEITPCNKIDKPLVVYKFTGNVMTSITTLRT